MRTPVSVWRPAAHRAGEGRTERPDTCGPPQPGPRGVVTDTHTSLRGACGRAATGRGQQASFVSSFYPARLRFSLKGTGRSKMFFNRMLQREEITSFPAPARAPCPQEAPGQRETALGGPQGLRGAYSRPEPELGSLLSPGDRDRDS